MSGKEVAPKNDQDPYEKYDLSLVPWREIKDHFPECTEKKDFLSIHIVLNQNKPEIDLQIQLSLMLNEMIRVHGPKPLAVALGFGVEKYFRDSWKKGFCGNYKRILKAYLRHCQKHLLGEEFDGDSEGLFTKGCPHIGSMMWCLMVAKQELNTHFKIIENCNKQTTQN